MATLEQQVLGLCKKKDVMTAFSLVYDELGDSLAGVCRHLAGRSGEGEDAFQELCMAIYGALPKYRGDAKLQTWCYRIAVRISLRVSSRQKKNTVDFDVSQLAARNEPSESIEIRDEENRIHTAIAGLKAEYRVALCLSLFESLSAGEIADILGVETGTIWTRLHRARQSLATALKQGEKRRLGTKTQRKYVIGEPR